MQETKIRYENLFATTYSEGQPKTAEKAILSNFINKAQGDKKQVIYK